MWRVSSRSSSSSSSSGCRCREAAHVHMSVEWPAADVAPVDDDLLARDTYVRHEPRMARCEARGQQLRRVRRPPTRLVCRGMHE